MSYPLLCNRLYKLSSAHAHTRTRTLARAAGSVAVAGGLRFARPSARPRRRCSRGAARRGPSEAQRGRMGFGSECGCWQGSAPWAVGWEPVFWPVVTRRQPQLSATGVPPCGNLPPKASKEEMLPLPQKSQK